MIICSWNVNGFNTCDKFGGFTEILKMHPDIICLQEVKVSDSNILNTFWTFQYEQYYNFSSKKGHNGVYIYSKNKPINIIEKIGLPRFDTDGRFLCLEFDAFYMVNVYMPHGGRDKRDLAYKMDAYKFLKDFLSKFCDKKIIIAGDFNIAYSELEVERYRTNQDNIMFTLEERNSFKELLKAGYVDAFRELNPLLKAYTWWPYAFNSRERNIGWRLDYYLISLSLINKVRSVEIMKNILGSDHCPVKMLLDL